MDFVRIATGGGGDSGSGLSSENGPILYTEPNRTSAIEDIRSVIIYIFFATLLIGFFLILPGIRHDKIPTILCIPTSLVVTCIILAALTGTTWHVGDAPISASYKAFSKDRIQGDLSVKIGLQSVNITLKAQKYYILHATHGPMIMDNLTPMSVTASVASMVVGFAKSESQNATTKTSATNADDKGEDSSQEEGTISASKVIVNHQPDQDSINTQENPFIPTSISDSDSVIAVDSEPDSDEPFSSTSENERKARSATINRKKKKKRQTSTKTENLHLNSQAQSSISIAGQKYSIKRVNVDINYNERFYWIEPNQMRQEHHKALERGLPYPILTVVEYLSQDEAGFSWSRQYRLAGYYTFILLSLSLCTCGLMFLLHCAAPEYAIYTLQIIGLLLLFTNFTYAMLVPKGDQKLVIPFEGQSLELDFGYDFWLVFVGGCLALVIGTLVSMINSLFPNFTLTTILDADFDANNGYYRHRRQLSLNNQQQTATL